VSNVEGISRASTLSYLPDRFASAAASSRSFAMVAATESLRFPLFCRRLVFVV
jgi:hypothetical protein